MITGPCAMLACCAMNVGGRLISVKVSSVARHLPLRLERKSQVAVELVDRLRLGRQVRQVCEHRVQRDRLRGQEGFGVSEVTTMNAVDGGVELHEALGEVHIPEGGR